MSIDADLIWQTLAPIPKWVYPAVFMLLYIGIQSLRPITIPVKRLFYFPLIFVALSFIVIFKMIPLTTLNIAAWIGGCIPAIFMGWYQLHALRVKVIKNTSIIYVPGSWSILLFVVFLVVLKFYVRYRLSDIDPQILKEPRYALLFMAAYGVLTGLFIGRVGHALYRVKHGPFIEPEAIKNFRPLP